MTEKPPRHALRRNKRGKRGKREVRAGKLFLQREIAARTGLTRDQATAAMDAFGQLAREVLLNGFRLRIGQCGHIGLVVRKGLNPEDGMTFPLLVLMGRCDKRLKRAWRELHFKAWAAEQEEQGYEVAEPEWGG